MAVDEVRLKGLRQPVDIVLDCDLEKLRRKDEVSRAQLWNQIRSNESAFEQEFHGELPQERRGEIASAFTLSRLLLAAAAHANDEHSPILKNFSTVEITLVSN